MSITEQDVRTEFLAWLNEHLPKGWIEAVDAGDDAALGKARPASDGQKVWTTLAHIASYGLLVARTNPDAPKHTGLSYFIVDMHAPGVEGRPLKQITGDAEFNEAFFTDVRIHDSHRLGNEGDGWKV